MSTNRHEPWGGGLIGAFLLQVLSVFLIGAAAGFQIGTRVATKDFKRELEANKPIWKSDGFTDGVHACIKHVKGTGCSVDLAEVFAEEGKQ
jgi:hypothetical protein